MNEPDDSGSHIVGPPLDPEEVLRALAWRVYCMNDYPEFFVARSLEEAKAAAAEHWGDDDPSLTEDAYELTDEAMLDEKINVAEEGEPPDIRTFRWYLDSIAPSLREATFFASVD